AAGPRRRSWRGLRTAALARSEPGSLGRRGAGIEVDILQLRGRRRADGAAVDTGRAHADEEAPVEAPVAAAHRRITAVAIELHAGSVAQPRRPGLAIAGRGRRYGVRRLAVALGWAGDGGETAEERRHQ